MATLIEGDQKAPFSIAITQRCRGGCYLIPWIARPRIELQSPGPLVNTLPTMVLETGVQSLIESYQDLKNGT